ncbi:HEAT repeat domain-containing protein [Paludisphaera soli]|uniref:HEAT repeat domain-containing protein n=1 Tax=Paludisphaera soli TaxID=2712865 RepID=UPI0013EA5F91|nr:HEAT repeat domain-containing protein [Paludisphaera soli]
MPSPNPPIDPGEPPDLPPVELPSSGFFARLFLIPAGVVLAVVAVWLLFGRLAGGGRDALAYVWEIRSGAAGWRSAYELATLIGNDPGLARDPELLGELTAMLEDELTGASEPEMTRYLALALGTFQTLDARSTDGRAVDALATLAVALDARQVEPVRLAAAASLARHAARLAGKLDEAHVIDALRGAARASDSPELRRLAVFALGFCGGRGATEALADRARDDPDRFVRYNAAIALARRGDASALGPLREMLATEELREAVRGPELADLSDLVDTIQVQAVEALAGSGEIGTFAGLRPELEALARSGSTPLRRSAGQALQKLQSGRKL